jgi:hypothetical protein
MKNIFYFFVLTLLVFTCKNENSETAAMDEAPVEGQISSLKGVWELVSYYNYDDNEVTDTIMSTPANRQVKMFSDSKVMWSRIVPRDASEYFGYGSYVITDSTLIETLDYGSAAMLTVIDTMKVFSFELIRTEDTFSQIQLGPEGNRVFSENYERIKD